MSDNIRGSAGRLGRMARQGDRVAVFKLAAILIVGGVVAWFVLGWIWGLLFGR
jgi:blocked early in transport 1